MNTDDLKALWDCVTRFHRRFFESEPQPRATQIKLLHEELGELTAAYLTGDGSVTEEAVDVLFVAFGMMQQIPYDFNEIDFSVPYTYGLPEAIDDFGYVWSQRSLLSKPRFEALMPAILGHFISSDTTPEQWHAAVTTVITKNDAKTPEAGYRVNAGGKVTKS